MAENGRLTSAELAPIPGGQLSNAAAEAWNSPGGPADHRLRPGGPDSSYRTYDRQIYWRDYWCGQGNCGNAAVPGTSNHGLGLAIDCPNLWEQFWLHASGTKFGWNKTEAWDEPWHWTFTGTGDHALKPGHRGRWVRKYRARLRFLGYPLPRGRKFDLQMKGHVEVFQKRHGLKVTGEIDGMTAYHINRAMHRRGK